MIDRIIAWMSNPKTRRELIVLRLLKVVAFLIGVALIVAAFKVGTHPQP